MNGPEATLMAATAAAGVASIGLIWSVVSFFITRHVTKTTAARSEWRSRFDQAHALALSADPNEAKSGALLMKSLSTGKWVTDADRATTASVLLGLPPEDRQTSKVQEILSAVDDMAVAAALAKVEQGPKGKFELIQTKSGDWRWSFRAANGERTAASEPFSSRAAAMRGLQGFRNGNNGIGH